MKLKYYMRGLGIGILVTSAVAGLTGGSGELTDAQIKARAASLGMVEQTSPSQLANEGLADRETSQEEALMQEAAAQEMSAEASATEEAKGTEEAESTGETTEAPEDSEDEGAEAQEEVTTEDPAESEATPGEEQEETDPDVQEEDPEVTTVSSTAGDSEEASGAGEEMAAEAGSIEVEGAENYVIINIERGNGSDIVAHKLYEAGLIPSAKEYDRYLVENGYDRRLEAGYHEIPTGSTWEEMAKILCTQ